MAVLICNAEHTLPDHGHEVIIIMC